MRSWRGKAYKLLTRSHGTNRGTRTAYMKFSPDASLMQRLIIHERSHGTLKTWTVPIGRTISSLPVWWISTVTCVEQIRHRSSYINRKPVLNVNILLGCLEKMNYRYQLLKSLEIFEFVCLFVLFLATPTPAPTQRKATPRVSLK